MTALVSFSNHPARACWLEGLITLALVLPGLAFLKTTGHIGLYLQYEVSSGQLCYLLAKLCGLYAMVFLWLQLLYGLLGWTVDRGASLHRNLGISVVVLFLSHLGFFIAAVSLRNRHFAYDLLLPHWFGPYYPRLLSLGLIAAWLLLIAAAMATLRKRLATAWLWFHRLTWPAFFLVFFHSYLIGSETRVGAMAYFYYVMFGSTLAAILYRVFRGPALFASQQ